MHIFALFCFKIAISVLVVEAKSPQGIITNKNNEDVKNFGKPVLY